jgi:hypothetical protein
VNKLSKAGSMGTKKHGQPSQRVWIGFVVPDTCEPTSGPRKLLLLSEQSVKCLHCRFDGFQFCHIWSSGEYEFFKLPQQSFVALMRLPFSEYDA